ncbi:MAG: Threonine synthase terminus, partial [Pseudomonadota bacterium]
MKLVSTRNRALQSSVSDAIVKGIAPDGGLYVPEQFPKLDLSSFAGATELPEVA